MASIIGLTITACPLAPNSRAYEYVEIFSAGWNERPNFAISNRSKAISVEFLRPQNGDFSFSWMEITPRPTISIAGNNPPNNFPICPNPFAAKLIYLIISPTK